MLSETIYICHKEAYDTGKFLMKIVKILNQRLNDLLRGLNQIAADVSSKH